MRMQTFFALILLFLAASCTTNKPILIGILGNFSGMDSQIAVQGRFVSKLVIDRINQAGGIRGRKLELVVGDTRNDPDIALAETMIMHDKGVIAIIAPSTSNPLVKVFDYINSNKIILITATASSSFFRNEDDYFFRINLRTSDEAKSLAATAFQDLGLRRMAGIYDNKNLLYAKELVSQFKNDFQSMGGSMTFMTDFGSGNEKEIRAIVRKIAANRNNVQGIILGASSMDSALFGQLMAKEGVTIPILCGKWSVNVSLIRNSGKAAGLFYLTGEYDMESTNAEYLALKKSYFSYYRENPSNLNPNDYETMMILVDAMLKCPVITSRTLRDEIMRQRTYWGIMRPLEFNSTGEAYRSVYRFRIIDGKFKTLDE